MTTLVFDGAAMAREVFDELRPRVAELAKRGVKPGLATVVVGDNAASKVYVRNKLRACAEVGLHGEVHELAADATESEVLDHVQTLNGRRDIHGIIVQLPLPPGVDSHRILQSIAIEKDV